MTQSRTSEITRSGNRTSRLSDLDTKLTDLRFKVAALRFSTLLQKFDPDQPRDEIGRWTDGTDITGSTARSNPLDAFASFSNDAICNAQYKLDLIQCRMSGKAQCYHQALVRMKACESGSPIPPLNY